MDSGQKWLSSKFGTKNDKNQIDDNAKAPCTHLQTFTKGPRRFQIDQYKIVGGLAHTRYHLSCTLIVLKPKMGTSKGENNDKTSVIDNDKTTCIFTDHDKIACKISN